MKRTVHHNTAWRRSRGFTILEVVIAIGIITVGMVGILSLVIQSNKVNVHNNSALIAYMLAQEGIELVRNQRDTAQKTGGTIMNFTGTRTYRVDKDGIFTTSNTAMPLRLNANGEYQYGGTSAENTKFVRQITLTASDIGGGSSASDELRVLSQVSWVDSVGSSYNYPIETYLYDWR